ncbi:MAG: TRAP transporter small permease [Desulfovibrionaceae bacterium]|nr:TRAP transporter small permease [Desulfovibrionaceae bacterium]
MTSLLKYLNKICAEICGWMLSVVMILLLVDVICRTISKPVMGVAELAMFVMIGTVYAGLANCEMKHGHVRVDFFLDRLPPRLRHGIDIAIYVVAAVVIAATAWTMCDNAWSSFVDREGIAGAINYPLYPVKFVMSVGMILYFIQLVLNLIAMVRKAD